MGIGSVKTLDRASMEKVMQDFQSSDWAKINGMTQQEVGKIRLRSLIGQSKPNVRAAVNSGAPVMYQSDTGFIYPNSAHFVIANGLHPNALAAADESRTVDRIEYMEPYRTERSDRTDTFPFQRQVQSPIFEPDPDRPGRWRLKEYPSGPRYRYKDPFENGTFRWVAETGG